MDAESYADRQGRTQNFNINLGGCINDIKMRNKHIKLRRPNLRNIKYFDKIQF